MSIKVITFNGNGLGDEVKLHKVVTWCRRFKPNIIMLQETHCTERRQGWYNKAYDGIWYHSIGESNARGVSICVSRELNHLKNNIVIDDNGRYIVLDVTIDNKTYLIGNYYGANIDCPDHLEEYLNLLIPSEGQQIISAGDYNFVLNINMDKKRWQTTNSREIKKITHKLERDK